jgi:flagellar basal-body rod protein FlgB
MISGMFDRGSLPVLERLVQFTGQRQRVLADNIANLSTPFYKPRDLDPKAFQAALRSAVDRRRSSPSVDGGLTFEDTDQVKFRPDTVEIKPAATNDGVLYHDQNNRDLERTMQALAENTLTHNAGVELMRSEFETMKMAIRERV